VYKNPGYIEKKYDYIKLVDKSLEFQISLDNFCSYDEVMKTETSFHCHTCGRCVEQFDHHCPFINNCLGYRNHKYFAMFVFLYAAFLVVVLLETLRHFAEVCIDLKSDGPNCFNTEKYMFVVLLLVALNLPIIFY
jgi:DHHC palmitoyltransferase